MNSRLKFPCLLPQLLAVVAVFFCAAPLLAEEPEQTSESSNGQWVLLHAEAAPAYAEYATVLSRMYPELDHAAIAAERAPGGLTFDPAEEKWMIYVPAGDPPADGYRLLVWIDPAELPAIPELWQAVLDEQQLMLVTALASGNAHSVTRRRAPLALTGLALARSAYSIDTEQIIVGGFSGGSKTAQMIAFGFPDIFRGALLSGGVIQTNTNDISWPPGSLLNLLKDDYFYIAGGSRDPLVQPELPALRTRLNRAGMKNVMFRTLPFSGHERMKAGEFRLAMEYLLD